MSMVIRPTATTARTRVGSILLKIPGEAQMHPMANLVSHTARASILAAPHAGDMAAIIHRLIRVAVALGVALEAAPDVERVAGRPIPHEGVIRSRPPTTTGSITIL